MEIKQQRTFLYARMQAEAAGFGLKINETLSAPERPWGAYLCIDESSFPVFRAAYWDGVTLPDSYRADQKIDPKILLIAPGARLSLQYHHRRQELWRVLTGPVKIILGPDGTSLEEQTYNSGDCIEIPQGYWHRIAGGSNWGIIAEIWQHTDPANPSDEDDIVRIEDDYSRHTGQL